MSRVRETLEQEAGRQLPQGAGVHASDPVYDRPKRKMKPKGMKYKNGKRGR